MSRGKSLLPSATGYPECLIVRKDGKVSTVISQPSAHHTVRLQALHQPVELIALTGRQRAHIKPELVHRPILGQ